MMTFSVRESFGGLFLSVKTALALLVLALSPLVLGGPALAANYVQYDAKAGNTLSYDKDSVRQESPGVFTFLSVLKMSDANARQYSMRAGYTKTCTSSMQVMSINCSNNTFTILKMMDVSADNTMLMNKTASGVGWQPIAPGGPMDKLKRMLCR